MEIDDKYKDILQLLNNNDLFNKDLLKRIVENCCWTLSGRNAVNDVSYSDVESAQIKQVYGSLLYIFTEFVRNTQSKDDFIQFLQKECNLNNDVTHILGDFYEKWKMHIRIQLLNIGNQLPHVTDVKWKIDHIMESSSLNHLEEPIFRISLKLEKFDRHLESPRIEFLNFSCSSQELQDLVYKLKDSVKHCQKLSMDY